MNIETVVTWFVAAIIAFITWVGLHELVVDKPSTPCDAFTTAVIERPADYPPALVSTMLDGLGCEE